jgi:hypothetical protein
VMVTTATTGEAAHTMSNAYPSGSKKHEVGKGMERSPEQPESYVLRGGQAGAERLRLINRVKWPTTERLLGTAGLRAGTLSHEDQLPSRKPGRRSQNLHCPVQYRKGCRRKDIRKT